MGAARLAVRGGVGGGCGALLSECLGELPTESVVVPGECAVAFVGGLETAQQRGVGCALAGWDGRGGRPVGGVAQSLDLGADIGLGVEPGPGDVGCACDGFECDRRAGT